LISAVKDEARFIEATINSVVRQRLLPTRWVIVDDGSRDETVALVRRHQAQHSFIEVVMHDRAGQRHPGSRVIHAFNRGLERVRDPFDFVVKLDCDLTFSDDYFVTLLARFAQNPRLGIASGIYLEASGTGAWRHVPMPSYHAFGACKVVRRECFGDIRGFLTVPGWDTVDEIKAWRCGWETRHFSDLQVRHHRPEGTGIGRLRTSWMHGQIFYRTGGDPLFFAFKAARRAVGAPPLAGALALVGGYGAAFLNRMPRLVTDDEARHYRRLLRQRLIGGHALSHKPDAASTS
jgi:glycosyltransferase involved in cell wall biosynthesis